MIGWSMKNCSTKEVFYSISEIKAYQMDPWKMPWCSNERINWQLRKDIMHLATNIFNSILTKEVGKYYTPFSISEGA